VELNMQSWFLPFKTRKSFPLIVLLVVKRQSSQKKFYVFEFETSNYLQKFVKLSSLSVFVDAVSSEAPDAAIRLCPGITGKYDDRAHSLQHIGKLSGTNRITLY